MASTTPAPFADPLWHSRPSSAYYKDSHRRLQKETREYVDVHIKPFCEEWERLGHVPREVIDRHAQLGYMAVSVYPLATEYLQEHRLPGDVPAEEWDGFHDLVVIDEIARCGYLGVIWALTCGNSIGAPPLVNFGSKEQKKRFIPAILDGTSRFCLGVTEPDAGSDVAGITTTAERRDDVYIVNGAKKWITNGIFADYCTAAVRTAEGGQNSISALIIPLKSKGVTCRKIDNSGVHASGSTYIEFDDVEVPVANLLGREGHGFEIIMSSKMTRRTTEQEDSLTVADFNHERLWLACTSLRMARCCIEDAYHYANVRETFGRKLITNQTIRSKFSSSGRRIDSAYAWMEQLVDIVESSKHGKTDTYIGGLMANLKVLAGQTLEFVNRESQQVLGGLGYSKTGRGARIEQISRDVRVMVVGGGSEEILTDLAIKQEIKAMSRLQTEKPKL